jgi:hypothetical protein
MAPNHLQKDSVQNRQRLFAVLPKYFFKWFCRSLFALLAYIIQESFSE